MAKPRKSSAAVAAREKARKQAEEITRRNEELIGLAADYFVEVDRVEAIHEETERKVRELREKAEEQTQQSRQQAAETVALMVATGESRRGVAERLGISAAEVGRLVKSTQQSDASSSSPSSEASSSERDDAGEVSPDR